MSEGSTVRVTRRIQAPASAVFAVLSDPARHTEIDGSGMLRGSTDAPPTAVGQSFVMGMCHPAMGDYETDNLIVEFESDRRIGWEPCAVGSARDSETRNGSRWSFELVPVDAQATDVTEVYDCSGSPEMVRTAVNEGANWTAAMTATLERLEQACGNSVSL